MQYIIIQRDGVSSLEKEVEKHIKEGWIPQGGVCYAYIFHKDEYKQAMVKHEQDGLPW